MIRALLALLAATFVAACAAPSGTLSGDGGARLDAAQLLEASPLDSDDVVDVADVDILAPSPEMAAFLDEYVDPGGNDNERLGQLVLALIGGDRFRLDYDDSTRTTAETFAERRGNCLSFTTMFVSMARALDLDARYQEVEIPPDWSMRGQSFLISQHVNASVEMRNALSRVVDFNTYEFNALNESRVIPDSRARAHYFSNLGVEYMLAGDSPGAYAYLRQSLREDPDFAPAWVNMGILHRREGFPRYAESAYLEALKHERDNLMAMSNLADLYQDEGREDLAGHYLDRVRQHRASNPYYRYQQANVAFSEGDYETAIDNLKYAIRKRRDEDTFHYLLSLSYLMQGRKEEAREAMMQAEELARQGSDRQRYHHKLELLMGRDAG